MKARIEMAKNVYMQDLASSNLVADARLFILIQPRSPVS